MREKSKLKSEYKQLVRARNLEKAQRVLEKVWELCGIVKYKKAKVISKSKKYSRKDLEKLSFKQLKAIGSKFGTTDRSKKNLIKEILELQ